MVRPLPQRGANGSISHFFLSILCIKHFTAVLTPTSCPGSSLVWRATRDEDPGKIGKNSQSNWSTFNIVFGTSDFFPIRFQWTTRPTGPVRFAIKTLSRSMKMFLNRPIERTIYLRLILIMNLKDLPCELCRCAIAILK